MWLFLLPEKLETHQYFRQQVTKMAVIHAAAQDNLFFFFHLEIMALTQLNVSKSSGRQCSQIIYQGTQTGPFMQPFFCAKPVNDRKSSLRKERQKTQMAAHFKFPDTLALNFVSRAPTSALLVNCCMF